MASLPVKKTEALKRTNEIKMAIPLLETIDIQGKQVTADALLTQRRLADYLVRQRKAHYHFTVKANQPKLFEDLKLFFQGRRQPDFVDDACCEHGRIEIRKIWTTTELNGYLNFPHVGQAFVIERQSTEKKSGEHSHETAYGITSQSPPQADARSLLATNRGHWSIENSCHHVLDMTWDEDRCRIRTGYGPENTSRLRRFAISILNLHASPGDSIASMTRRLAAKTRLVFDYLLMTRNSTGHAAVA